MLSLSDYSGHRDNTSFTTNDQSGSDESGRVRPIESRKGYLTQQEIQSVASMCGELARAIGYEDEDFDFYRSRKEGSDSRVGRKLTRIGKWIGGI